MSLTTEQIGELERHARLAGGGVCTVESAELLELVTAYRFCLLLGDLIREIRGGLAPVLRREVAAACALECIFCKQLREPDSRFCKRHEGGFPLADD